MAYEQRDMSGALFPNKDKKTDKHPNLTGNIMVAGVEYRISGWTKEGKNGKWISLAVSEKEAPKPQRGPVGDLENDIPFMNPYHGRISHVV